LTVASALDLVYFRSPFEARRFEYIEVDGKQNKGLWFRFKKPGEETSQVDESLTPLSAKAKEYLLRAWRLRDTFTLRERIFRTPDVVALICENRVSQLTAQN
jgi:hypothetical protein